MPTPFETYKRFLSDPAFIPPSSRVGSAISGTRNFLQDQARVAAEMGRQNNPLTVLSKAGSFLFDPQAPQAAATPGVRQRQPAPDFDSVPGESFGDVLSGASSSSMREFAPGVKFSDSGRTAGDAQAIEGLKARSGGNLRPLLAARGDNSGPLSLADMENNQNAMDKLDDFFTNAPQEQRVRELQGQALEREFDEAVADPLWKERAKFGMEFDKLAGLETFKAGLKQRQAGALQGQVEELDKEEAQGMSDLQALQSQPEYLALAKRAASDPAAAQQLKAVEGPIRQQISEAQTRKRSLLQSYGMATGKTPSALFEEPPQGII